MALTDSDLTRYDQLLSEFRDGWTENLRPRLYEFLDRVPDTERDRFASKLVSVDVRCRLDAGEHPHADEYILFGTLAVESARQELGEEQTESARNSTDLLSSEDLSEAPTQVAGTGSTFVDASEPPQTNIGPYRLIRELGRGGMGSVWLAEQTHPVRRTVAIKLIRRDVDSHLTLTRFELEREAIAMMDHPHIARILDAGTTIKGTPYFVMEYVDGSRFDRFCDHRQLTIRQRLRLFVKVCRAVQHAHQKGIIHRDLKHSNVLVSQPEGSELPKVIDFGLAKALDRATSGDSVTSLGEVVGTIQYMSPEQAAGEKVDTRTDIYALGVMLFKLLTGTTPVQSSDVSRCSFIELLNLIRTRDPERPSERINSLESTRLEAVSEQRGVRPDQLVRCLRGDLDWVVMKALEKRPEDRYETVDGLALDLERYLDDELVTARPPTAIYRIRKFGRRNRAFVASLVVFLSMLVAGVVGTSLSLFYAVRERDRANDNANRARQQTIVALKAEKTARESEAEQRRLRDQSAAQLHAIRAKSALSNWQIGDTESAWEMLKSIRMKDGWETRFLHSEFSSSEHVFYGHALPVIDVAVSMDGRYVATASADATVRIWDIRTKELHRRILLSAAATAVTISPDSTIVAAVDRANMVTVTTVDADAKVSVFGPFDRDITAAAFLGQDTLVVAEADTDSVRDGLAWEDVSHGSPQIHLLDPSTGESLAVLTGHRKTVTSLACAGGSIVSGSKDGTVRVWTKSADSWESKQPDEVSPVLGVAVSPDGHKIACACEDATIRLWHNGTGSQPQTLVGHSSAAASVRFSPDGTRIVSGSHDRTARVWRLDGTLEKTLRGHFNSVNAAAFTADGEHIVSCADDYTCRLWKLQAKRGTIEKKVHKGSVWAADFTRDSRRVVSVSEAGTVVLCDAETGQEVASQDEGQPVLAVAASPTADIVVTAGEADEITVRSTTDLSVVAKLAGHRNLVWDLAFSPDGKLLLSSCSDRTVRVWSTDDWSLVDTLEGHTSELGSARFSPDGKLIVTASDDRTVILWDAKNFERLATLIGHKHSVWRAVFSPDGKRIASSSYGGEILIWDVASHKLVREIQAHTDQVAGLTFTPDGTRVISASDDQTIKVWDIENGIDYFVLRDRDDSQVIGLRFSPDGRKLVSGNSGGWVTIRTASQVERRNPFLPRESIALTTEGERLLLQPDLDRSVIERELKTATQCCNHFPTYRSWTNRGVAEVRLGRFSESVSSLLEAQRLEPIEYGEPDVRPIIEGYLTLAYHGSGQNTLADRARQSFIKKSKSDLWIEDAIVLRLADQIEEALGASP